jgi:hypothetical protein
MPFPSLEEKKNPHGMNLKNVIILPFCSTTSAQHGMWVPSYAAAMASVSPMRISAELHLRRMDPHGRRS